MKLPDVKAALFTSGFPALHAWSELQAKASKIEDTAGQSSAFEQMSILLRNMAKSGRFVELPTLLKRRVTARALTWLWLSEDPLSGRLLSPQILSELVHAQQPRLTRISLQQLVQLYFRRFDLLDEYDGFRVLLEQTLLSQLELIPPPRIEVQRPNSLIVLKHEGRRLIAADGPRQLAEQTLQAGRELGVAFSELGLQGLDDGRYGDVCRAHFYLVTLRNLSPDEWSPVMDELLKPTVSKAPYEGDRCIGHAALEILIDRTTEEPSDAWQTFILNLAGDPRIASSAANFRQWWQPLGEARIDKVRGWLSKEDLRLFLQAVEQYGIQSHNGELQRMFPARKLFLEGLFKLKLIRNTRLLLGNKAQQIVKEILGDEVKTSFATMDGGMNDKAVIYLDCGDFYLVEGSHSFKIWVYLAPPSELLTSYENRIFSHSLLTSTIPTDYNKRYHKLPIGSFVHTPNVWQHRVFAFLAENGISLDMEQLLSPKDYQDQLLRFGVPVVNPYRTKIPAPSLPSVSASEYKVTRPRTLADISRARASKHATFEATFNRDTLLPSDKATREANKYSPSLVSKRFDELKFEGKSASAMPCSKRETIAKAESASFKSHAERCPLISQLTPKELKLLKLVGANLGDKTIRNAAEALNISVLDVANMLIRGPLAKLCKYDAQYGWRLTPEASEELAAYDQHLLNTSGISSVDPKTIHASDQQPTVAEEAIEAKQTALGSLRLTETVQNIDKQKEMAPASVLASKPSDKFEYIEQPASAMVHLDKTVCAGPADMRSTPLSEKCPRVSQLKLLELKVLKYVSNHAGDKAQNVANALGVTVPDVNKLLRGSLAKLCQEDEESGWHLTSDASEELAAYEGYQLHDAAFPVIATPGKKVATTRTVSDLAPSSMVVSNKKTTGAKPEHGASVSAVNAPPISRLEKCARVSRLKPIELKVLKYLSANAGDRARHVANVLGITVKEVNKLLYGPLKNLCRQDSDFGWRLKSAAVEELAVYEKYQRDN